MWVSCEITEELSSLINVCFLETIKSIDMKILLFSLLFVAHQLSFASYTQTQIEIRNKVIEAIASSIPFAGEIKERLLNANPHEYENLLISAQTWSSTSTNADYCNTEAKSSEAIAHLNNYLSEISKRFSEQANINFSNEFKADITSLVSAFNSASPDEHPIKLPDFFSIADSSAQNRFHSWSKFYPKREIPTQTSQSKKKRLFPLAIYSVIGWFRSKSKKDYHQIPEYPPPVYSFNPPNKN